MSSSVFRRNAFKRKLKKLVQCETVVTKDDQNHQTDLDLLQDLGCDLLTGELLRRRVELQLVKI